MKVPIPLIVSDIHREKEETAAVWIQSQFFFCDPGKNSLEISFHLEPFTIIGTVTVCTSPRHLLQPINLSKHASIAKLEVQQYSLQFKYTNKLSVGPKRGIELGFLTCLIDDAAFSCRLWWWTD